VKTHPGYFVDKTKIEGFSKKKMLIFIFLFFEYFKIKSFLLRETQISIINRKKKISKISISVLKGAMTVSTTTVSTTTLSIMTVSTMTLCITINNTQDLTATTEQNDTWHNLIELLNFVLLY
jgi:hypothetical protein